MILEEDLRFRNTSASGEVDGHTLIEALVVLAILTLAILGVRFLASGVRAAEERGAAQVLEAAVSSAQLHQHWQTDEVSLEIRQAGIRLSSNHGYQEEYTCSPTSSLTANVAAWRTSPDSLALTISGPLASPDSGGTISIGERAGVVIRPESGFTRRTP